MFSENNQVSGRQIFRLLTYDLIGPSTLLLPPLLARIAGNDGVFCLFAGTVAGLVYLWLLSRVTKEMTVDFKTFLRERCGVVAEKIILMFYACYFLLFAAVLAFLFAELVVENLLQEESFYLVLVLLLALTGYGIYAGIEGRARIYELLFWVVLIPLFLMLIAAGKSVDTDFWAPVAVTSPGAFLKGSYLVFLWQSLVFLLFFFYPNAAKKETLMQNGRRAVFFAGGLNLVLYLVLTGVFGAKALSGMEYPAVTLMSIVQMPGGFLKRTDALMFGIWFFTLYALLNSLSFYGAKAARDVIQKGKEKIYMFVVLLIVFLLAVLCYRQQEWKEIISRFVWGVGTPAVALLPLVAALLPKQEKWKQSGKKVLGLVIFLGMAGILTGCNTLEVEDRKFPLAVAVAEKEDIELLWLEQEEAGNKEMDYNHLKVMVLGQELLEDEEAVEELLGILAANPKIPRNTYVVVAENPSEILELNETLQEKESAGTYLEELLEGNASMKETAYPTLGKLYQERENRQETLFLPFLASQNGTPYVQKYFVWKRGAAAGCVSTTTAMLSAMLQGELEKETLVFEDGNSIKLKEFSVDETFVEAKDGRKIIAEVSCEGEVLYEKEQVVGNREREYEQKLVEYYRTIIAKAEQKGVDISNGYKKIGGYQRAWYTEYQENPDAFEQDVSLELEMNLHLVR